MSNMSHCRFHNTLLDLRDCFEQIEEECSLVEHKARRRLIQLCWDIAANYCDEDGKVEELAHEKED